MKTPYDETQAHGEPVRDVLVGVMVFRQEAIARQVSFLKGLGHVKGAGAILRLCAQYAIASVAAVGDECERVTTLCYEIMTPGAGAA